MIKLLKAEVVEWQTRWTQNPLLETTCGFKSHLRHQKIPNPMRVGDFLIHVLLLLNLSFLLYRIYRVDYHKVQQLFYC